MFAKLLLVKKSTSKESQRNLNFPQTGLCRSKQPCIISHWLIIREKATYRAFILVTTQFKKRNFLEENLKFHIIFKFSRVEMGFPKKCFNEEQDIVPKRCRLNEVMKIIEVNQRNRKEDLKHFETVWKQLCSELEKDAVFKELHQGGEFIGNHGDNIKINQSDEYDFQFYFCLPDPEKLNLISSGGTVLINIENILLGKHSSSLVHKKLQELADKDLFLIPGKINAWLRKLVTTYIKSSYSFQHGGHSYKMSHSKHGCAELLHINIDGNVYFEVNIYPCIKLQSNQHWVTERKMVDVTSFWTAVTKKQKGDPRAFQCSYEHIEKSMLGSLNQLKNALKLLMKIRDKDMLRLLKTHYLKNVCLWFVEETNADSLNNLDTKAVLITVFSRLLRFLKEGKIPSFWHTNDSLTRCDSLIDPLQQAYEKAIQNQIPWAFCNKNERVFYYGIPKKLSYVRGHGRQFDFKNSHLHIPDDEC